MWGLLIANHLDQSLWSTNQKYWAAVKSNLLHSFLEVHNCVAPSTIYGKLHEFGAEKPISWAQPAHFILFAINFIVWSHILTTGGDALSKESSVGDTVVVVGMTCMTITLLFVSSFDICIPLFQYFCLQFAMKMINSTLLLHPCPCTWWFLWLILERILPPLHLCGFTNFVSGFLFCTAGNRW
jgi:hypothetical protein